MKNIAKGVLLTDDLQDGYNFPSHIVCTGPYIMWWELTILSIPFGGGSFTEERQECRAHGIHRKGWVI